MLSLAPIERFILSSASTAWVKCGSFNIFMRKGSYHCIGDEVVECFDLANIENKPKQCGKGQFKELLPRLVELARDHGYKVFYIESVINDRLLPLFEQMGFTPIPRSVPPCFYKKLEKVEKSS